MSPLAFFPPRPAFVREYLSLWCDPVLPLPVVEVAGAGGDHAPSFALLREALDARLQLFVRQPRRRFAAGSGAAVHKVIGVVGVVVVAATRAPFFLCAPRRHVGWLEA